MYHIPSSSYSDCASKDVFLKLYKALVRPHLEYGNVFWYPIFKRQSIAIERVQRRATKLVKGCRNLSYNSRLKCLRLHSLKGRRIRGDLIQTYKIFKGLDDIDKEKLFTLSHIQCTRNPEGKMFKMHHETNIWVIFKNCHQITEKKNFSKSF